MIELKIPDVPLAESGDTRERQSFMYDNRVRAAQQLAQRLPARFADAAITVPAIAAWAQELIDAAMRRPRHSAHPPDGRACDCGPTLRPEIKTGSSLLIVGPVGTGKTWQSYGAIRQLSNSGLLSGWVFITAPDMFGRLRPQSGVDTERQFQELATAALLVVDDLGASKGSEWTEEVLFRLVNHRYEQMKPTIFSSNLTGGELRDAVGERVASRLSTCTCVALTGPDRRRQAA